MNSESKKILWGVVAGALLMTSVVGCGSPVGHGGAKAGGGVDPNSIEAWDYNGRWSPLRLRKFVDPFRKNTVGSRQSGPVVKEYEVVRLEHVLDIDEGLRSLERNVGPHINPGISAIGDGIRGGLMALAKGMNAISVGGGGQTEEPKIDLNDQRFTRDAASPQERAARMAIGLLPYWDRLEFSVDTSRTDPRNQVFAVTGENPDTGAKMDIVYQRVASAQGKPLFHVSVAQKYGNFSIVHESYVQRHRSGAMFPVNVEESNGRLSGIKEFGTQWGNLQANIHVITEVATQIEKNKHHITQDCNARKAYEKRAQQKARQKNKSSKTKSHSSLQKPQILGQGMRVFVDGNEIVVGGPSRSVSFAKWQKGKNGPRCEV